MSETLSVTAHIEAAPETVFRFLSEPELIQKWLGPAASSYGEVLRSSPPRHLAVSWDTGSLVIDLAPSETGTTLTLTHPAAHAAGWAYHLGQLTLAIGNDAYSTTLPAAVAHYLAAWNATAPAVRQAHIAACWTSGSVFHDAMGSASGTAGLDAYIANAQKFIPGATLELAAPAEQNHGYYRFPWLIRLPDGNIMGRGTNFGQCTPQGRILTAIGFWDK